MTQIRCSRLLPIPLKTAPLRRYATGSKPKHHDLASFLIYANTTSLDPKSTFYVGTHFEYTVAQSLARYGFSLSRMGGTSDCGIDLLGDWTLPSLRALRVLIQCKASSKALGPNAARELQGAFVRAPVGWRGDLVLGLLVSPEHATRGVVDFLNMSRHPLGYFSCDRNGLVRQMLWNRRAQEDCLLGVGVSMHHRGPGEESQLLLTGPGGWRLPAIEGPDDAPSVPAESTPGADEFDISNNGLLPTADGSSCRNRA